MDRFFDNLDMKINNPREYSSVTLAYVGDSVFELFIRTYLLRNGNMKSGKLHRLAIDYVSAKRQANILDNIHSNLTNEEKDIVRIARNQKAVSVPKNSDIADYKAATAFEALIGYLYLNKEYKRMEEVLELCVLEDI